MKRDAFYEIIQKIAYFASKHLSSCQDTVIFHVLNKFQRTVLMKHSNLSVNNDALTTYLSLDHIKTGTGKKDSAQQHTKSEINPHHNKRVDEAAILEH